ncbi:MULTISPECIES: chemotaxis protein CheW [unclassified Pseudomonas]|uniref:chemotaxis protein CheW n=1 Tax=unclassified Pseudomonas TaxID=196821 RepID=UPI00119C5744|nr:MULTISPECIES: chemotaxis protein CheW [unclassified Pseudomonas]TWC18471.1 purine-binding chemotaxis protein CheW [Pseudomonas sp. SJZ075]TWC23476.1 purine-binding chemotaxis protein CheW [Pseudomonas sp. SJZ074]TWC34758.1 purine-binding chemotaxis protein CheW [Pseudomonas sp. SJZ078]TWC40577.1 purine-binding chemotaxis protein CheW [Pseudomonas sp. SJZ085]TWC55496.1 purine-binding chemotaxis protein CheW [Pseudomonas sp. SJZ124]
MSRLIKEHSPNGAPQPRQYLTFTLAGEQFAVGTLSVKEIIEYGRLTGVPMMPPSIRGVINLRGAVVPVIDLGVRFGGRQMEIGRRTCIVILEVDQVAERQVIGILVDAVNEVLEIDPAAIEPPPAFGAHVRADFIHGMGKVGDRFIILLDIGHVLSVNELATLEKVSGASGYEADN